MIRTFPITEIKSNLNISQDIRERVNIIRNEFPKAEIFIHPRERDPVAKQQIADTKPSIYVLIEPYTHKIYVGSALNGMNNRWNTHLSQSLHDHDKGVNGAIRSLKPDNWVVVRLHSCESHHIYNIETAWIAHFNLPDSKIGYNINKYGAGPHNSLESLQKISDNNKKTQPLRRANERLNDVNRTTDEAGRLKWGNVRYNLGKKYASSTVKCTETSEEKLLVYQNNILISTFSVKKPNPLLKVQDPSTLYTPHKYLPLGHSQTEQTKKKIHDSSLKTREDHRQGLQQRKVDVWGTICWANKRVSIGVEFAGKELFILERNKKMLDVFGSQDTNQILKSVSLQPKPALEKKSDQFSKILDSGGGTFINDKRVLIDLHRAKKEITFQKISDIQYRIFDHGKDLGLLDMNCPHPALHRQRAEYSEDRIEKSRETRLQQYAEARLLDQDCTLDRIGRKKFGRHTYYFGAEFAHQKGQIRETTDEVIFSQHGTILKKVPKKGQFPL